MTAECDFREISDAGTLVATPLVSVHMLAYRHEPCLAEAIEGVINQICDFPIELIVAEDCSPDGTLAIALDYQRRYPSIIRVLTGSKNVGMTKNVARFSAVSRGQYIAVCEGDDYWCDPTKLSRQVAIFQAYPECSLVFHAADVIDYFSKRKVAAHRRSLVSRMFSTEEIILGDGGLIPTASILIKAVIGRDERPWQKGSPVGDYPLALRAAMMGQVAYINRVMSVYRTNVPHSWTSRHKPQLASRMEYARRIESMLLGFAAEYGHRFDKPVAAMISKYYSDPLVRLPGTLSEKQAFYAQVAKKLNPADRLLTWIAVTTGMRMVLIKDLLRKSRTALRLAMAHLRSERVNDDMPSRSKPVGD